MDGARNSIRRQFNRSAAGSYDRHAHVQRIMADQLAGSLGGGGRKKVNRGRIFLRSAAETAL